MHYYRNPIHQLQHYRKLFQVLFSLFQILSFLFPLFPLLSSLSLLSPLPVLSPLGAYRSLSRGYYPRPSPPCLLLRPSCRLLKAVPLPLASFSVHPAAFLRRPTSLAGVSAPGASASGAFWSRNSERFFSLRSAVRVYFFNFNPLCFNLPSFPF